MKVLSITALAATFAVSSFAFASPGGPVQRIFGPGQVQERIDGYIGGGEDLPPPGPRPRVQCLTRADEPMLQTDVMGCIPPQVPTFCTANRTGATSGTVIVNSIDGQAVYKWYGLADDHGVLQGRINAMVSLHYCTAGVAIHDAPPGFFNGYGAFNGGW